MFDYKNYNEFCFKHGLVPGRLSSLIEYKESLE